MMTPSTGTTIPATLQFATALSRKTDTEAAVRDLADAIRMQIGTAPIDLAFVFFSAHHAAKAPMISTMLQSELRAKVSLGCSGEGVIAGAEEIETAAALTIWVACLPDVRLTPLQLSVSQLQDQIRMPGWPEPGLEDSTFLLLADPFSTPMQEILSLMTDRYPHGKAVGGLAGGGQDSGENRLLLNDQVFDGGVIGVQLTGPIAVRTVTSQGCRPIGERFVVTRAEGNLIYELGGVSALKRLQDIFESLGGAQRRDAHRALHLGIVIDEHGSHFERGDFLVRNLIGATICTFSWPRIEPSTGVPRSGPSCSAVAGAERGSSANPITIAAPCKSGLAPSLQRGSLPKARLVRSEGATSCTVTRQVWSFSPSLTPARNIHEKRSLSS
jgi:small ligand-binding sensory domain FIST